MCKNIGSYRSLTKIYENIGTVDRLYKHLTIGLQTWQTCADSVPWTCHEAGWWSCSCRPAVHAPTHAVSRSYHTGRERGVLSAGGVPRGYQTLGQHYSAPVYAELLDSRMDALPAAVPKYTQYQTRKFPLHKAHNNCCEFHCLIFLHTPSHCFKSVTFKQRTHIFVYIWCTTINQSINQKRIRVTKVTNVTAGPLLQC